MKFLIAIPCMDTVYTSFFSAMMNLRKPENTEISVCCSSLIYDARNILAKKAIDAGFTHILWLDSDMTFEPDMMERFVADIEEGRDFVAGLFFKRKPPVKPCIYTGCGLKRDENGNNVPFAVNYMDYPKDQVFEIAAAGFGAVMMSTAMIEKVHEHFGLPFSPAAGFGEDLSFCVRAKELGYPLYCDSRIKVGHTAMLTVSEDNWEAAL